MHFGSWFGGFDGAASATLQQVAMAYLLVSMLAPLSWMLAIEISRRLRTPARDAKGQRREPSLTRLAASIARSREQKNGRR
ncbi:MAG: hypothetical protein WD733_08955 [Bryobacterales bacterium]